MEEVTEDESISHEAAAFYSEIRGLVVVFLFFVILFSTAHLTLQHFVAKSISPDTKQDRADRTVHQMVLGICTFTLTISLTGYSLLPFSIVINEILVGFKHSYYVQWLNTGLIKDLALIVNMGTKIVCVLLPFSYFLLIAQGLRGTTNAFGSRLLEAICLLTFSFVLVFGTIWSVGTFLKALHTAAFGHSDLFSNIEFFSVHPVSFLLCSISSLSWTEVWTKFVLQTFVRSLECIQLLLSLLGLILLFACTPVGLLSIGFYLLTISISSLPDLKDKGLFSDQLAEVHFSALCIKDSRQSALLICDENPTWYDAMSILSHEELNYPLHKYPSKAKLLVFFNEKLVPLQLNYGRLKVRAAHNITSLMKHWFRPLAPCLVLGVIFCLLYLMESFVFFNIINLVQHLLVGHLTAISYESSLTDVKPELIGNNGSAFALGHKSASAFGRVGAFLQICVIHFLLILSLWGFYTVPAARHLRPKPHSLSLEVILGNVFFLILFSSALPLQSNLLGLTTLTLPSFLETSYSPSSTACGRQYQTSCSRMALVSPHKCPEFVTHPAHVEPKPSDTTRTLSPVRSDSSTSWPFWQVFIPFSFHPSAASHREFSSPTSVASSYVAHPEPAEQVTLDEQSVWSQLMSRAFGVSTPSTTSYGLLLIILLYNLCFLTTSVWFAGRRLGGATLSFSLEIITSLQCVHQHQLRGNGTRSINHNVDLSVGGVHFDLPTERMD